MSTLRNASASAQSVPGRTGSHTSALAPMGSSIGRMSIIFVPFSSAFRMARGTPWLTPEFSAFAPQLTMSLVFCQSSGAMLK